MGINTKKKGIKVVKVTPSGEGEKEKSKTGS